MAAVWPKQEEAILIESTTTPPCTASCLLKTPSDRMSSTPRSWVGSGLAVRVTVEGWGLG